MGNQFYFCGRVDARIMNGNLHIPPSIKSFYEADCYYTASKGLIEGYKCLTITPTDDLIRSSKHEIRSSDGLPDKPSPLEKLIYHCRIRGLKLEKEHIEHLGIDVRNNVLLVGLGHYFEVWKPEDFERYDNEHRSELGEILDKMAQLGV